MGRNTHRRVSAKKRRPGGRGRQIPLWFRPRGRCWLLQRLLDLPEKKAESDIRDFCGFSAVSWKYKATLHQATMLPARAMSTPASPHPTTKTHSGQLAAREISRLGLHPLRIFVGLRLGDLALIY
jgi:hypothetical protein